MMREQPAARAMEIDRARRWQCDWPLVAILSLSLFLNSFAFDYALPYPAPAEWQPAHFSVQNWAFDSIAPVDPLAAGRDLFSWGRWSQKVFDYPLAHYMVLGAAYAPYLLYVYLSGGFATAPSPGYPYGLADPTPVLTTLTLIARGLTMLMGTGIVSLVYGLTREFFDRRAALFAALIASCSYVLVAYAHTENLDVPYVLWATLALWAFARFYRRGGARAAALLGAGAAFAIATKDQAYALFTLLPIPVLVAHTRRVALRPLARWIFHPHLLAAGLAFVAALAIGNNLIFNFPRFLLHLQYLRTNPSYDRYLDPASIAEWGRLLGITLHHLQAAMGLPLMLVCGAGLIFGLWRRRETAWPLAVPLVSYYGLFIFGNLFYVHARHMLPLAVLLAPFGGALLADLTASTRLPRRVMWSGLAALFAYSLAYAFSASLTFAFDSRQLAREWMETNVPLGMRVEVYSPRMFLPRYLEDYDVAAAEFGADYAQDLRRRQPDVVIVTEQQYRTNADQPEAARYAEAARTDANLRGLLTGEFDYQLAGEFKFKMHDWLYTDSVYGQNPRILIFTRAQE